MLDAIADGRERDRRQVRLARAALSAAWGVLRAPTFDLEAAQTRTAARTADISLPFFADVMSSIEELLTAVRRLQTRPVCQNNPAASLSLASADDRLTAALELSKAAIATAVTDAADELW